MAKTEIVNNDAVTLRVDEAVGEVIEPVVETVERIVEVTRTNPLVVVGALLLGAGLGALVSYKLTEKRLTARYEEILSEEIAAAKEYHAKLLKTGEFSTPESAAAVLIPDEVVETVEKYQGRRSEPRTPYNKPSQITTVTAEVSETIVEKNVFVEAAKNDPRRDWDYAAEIAQREERPGEPYVISYDEFTENEYKHEQSTITYYSADDVLTDEHDSPIDDTDGLVGDDNLSRFGHGSTDHNTVYIRNEKLGMDYEIVRSPQSYSEAVFGVKDDTRELRHGHRSGRRFRHDDD